MVGDELAEVAKRFGTPRRTVLLEGGQAVAAAAVPLEVADDPCVVLMSATGLMARVAVTVTGPAPGDYPERVLVPPPGDATRVAHDVVISAVRATVRGTIGLVTSAGRLVKLNVLELPALLAQHTGSGRGRHVALAGGTPVTEFTALPRGETVVGLCAIDVPGALGGPGGFGGVGDGVALGTAEGVVKRVLPDYPQNRDEFELITLKDGDRVVGAVQLSGQLPAESAELVFITSDAQLLRFGADSVHPQGRAAGPA